jgi:hypothetical protein
MYTASQTQMSVELSIPKPENNTADTKRQFDIFYDEYAECLYGIILLLIDGEENTAVSRFEHVFAEVYKQQYEPCQTSQLSFRQFLLFSIQHLYKRGYTVQAIKKAIFA